MNTNTIAQLQKSNKELEAALKIAINLYLEQTMPDMTYYETRKKNKKFNEVKESIMEAVRSNMFPGAK